MHGDEGEKTYLNFQIPLFSGKWFCKLRVRDLWNASVRALLRYVAGGENYAPPPTQKIHGHIYCTVCKVGQSL